MKIKNNKNLLSKISIGTANFGIKYGINKKKISSKEIKKIFLILKKKKINYLDTAINYKNADIELGKYDLNDFLISSKIPKISNKRKNTYSYLINLVKNHIKKIGVSKLDTLYLHDISIIKNKNFKEILRGMSFMKKIGIIKKIGISIYDPSEIIKIYKFIKYDAIQAPFNILDQNIISKKYINFLKKKKIILEVRSIFLQGLLLSKKKFLKKFPTKKKLYIEFEKFIKKNNSSKIRFLTNYVLNLKDFNKVVIGINSSKELKEILNVISVKRTLKITNFVSKDKNLIYPYLWKND